MLIYLRRIWNHKFVILALTIILSLFLQIVPLTNTFDFEFCALISAWFFIAGGILYIKSGEKLSIVSFLRSTLYFIIFLILVPVVISIINTLFIQSCPIGDGTLFYPVISIISIILGIFIAAISIKLTTRHPYVVFSLFIFGFIAVSIMEIILYPQIYTYNPLIGLFPGTIYDELIECDLKLILNRLYDIVFFLTAFLILKNKERIIPQKIINIFKNRFLKFILGTIFVILFFISFWILNYLLSFSFPISSIENELKGKLITEHFIIIYPKGISEEKIYLSALHHEFYYNEVCSALGVTKKEKIISLLFSDNKQKKEFVGTLNADISKPWLNLVITEFSDHDLTLKHEIVHAISAEFGGKFLKLPYLLNPALLEGIAVAVEDKYVVQDEYSTAYLIRKYAPRLTISGLFSGFNFFNQVSSLSYAYSGAFVKYLIDNYGIDKFKKIYTDPDFEKYYGKGINELEKEFCQFIDSQNYSYNPNRAILFFAGKPLFLKKCPRYVASMMKKGDEKFNKKDYIKSLDIYKDVYFNSQSGPALKGILNSMLKLNMNEEALEYLLKEIPNFEKTNYYFMFQLLLADLFAKNNDFLNAANLYNKIIIENPFPDYAINSKLKLNLLSSGTDSLKKFLDGKPGSLDRNSFIKFLAGPDRLLWFYQIINMEKIEKADLQKLFKKMGKFEIKNDIELYVLSKISQFYKDQGCLTEAKELAVISVNYKAGNKGMEPLLKENLKKLNYLIIFGNDIKKKFIIN